MATNIRGDVQKAVESENSGYKENHDYLVNREDKFGAYSVWTVDFYGIKQEKQKRYTNYVITKDDKIIKVYHHIADIASYLDKTLSIKIFVMGNFALVFGASLAIILLLAIVILSVLNYGVQKELWVAFTATVGYVVGNQTAAKVQTKTE